MPSRNTYRLTWVSLTLDVGSLFTAAPAKRSRCSLPWTWRVTPLSCRLWPQTWGGSSWPLLRHHSLALSVSAPDFGRGVAPHGSASAWSIAAGVLLWGSRIHHNKFRVPCALSGYLLVIYFIYSSVYMSIHLTICPSPSLPPGNHKFIFYMYNCVSAL